MPDGFDGFVLLVLPAVMRLVADVVTHVFVSGSHAGCACWGHFVVCAHSAVLAYRGIF